MLVIEIARKRGIWSLESGAFPEVLLTDALNLALVGGNPPPGNFEISDLGNAISCVLRELFFEVHTSKSKRNLLDFREKT
jgi:hypothetical protein